MVHFRSSKSARARHCRSVVLPAAGCEADVSGSPAFRGVPALTAAVGQPLLRSTFPAGDDLIHFSISRSICLARHPPRRAADLESTSSSMSRQLRRACRVWRQSAAASMSRLGRVGTMSPISLASDRAEADLFRSAAGNAAAPARATRWSGTAHDSAIVYQWRK